MSWSVALPKGTVSELMEAINTVELGEYVTYARAEAQQQLDAGKNVLRGLLQSGAVGKPDSQFQASIGGHSNPDHVREGNWALEFVNVTLSEVVPAPAEPETPSTSEEA